MRLWGWIDLHCTTVRDSLDIIEIFQLFVNDKIGFKGLNKVYVYARHSHMC